MKSDNNGNKVINLKGFKPVEIKNNEIFEEALRTIPHCRIRNFRIVIERLNGFTEEGLIFLKRVEYWRVAVFQEKDSELRIFVPYLDSNNRYKAPFLFFTKGQIETEPIVENIIREINNIGKLGI